MKKDSMSTFHNYEYRVELKDELSQQQKETLDFLIRNLPLFKRTYINNGINWYELRKPVNQDIHQESDISLFIGSDWIYISKDEESVWKNLETIEEYLKIESKFTIKCQ